jgi:hypothetical protein
VGTAQARDYHEQYITALHEGPPPPAARPSPSQPS